MNGMTIRNLRTAAGLTQAELAARIGTSQSVLSAIETGQRLLTTRTLQRVASVLGLEVRIEVVDPPVNLDPDAASDSAA